MNEVDYIEEYYGVKFTLPQKIMLKMIINEETANPRYWDGYSEYKKVIKEYLMKNKFKVGDIVVKYKKTGDPLSSNIVSVCVVVRANNDQYTVCNLEKGCHSISSVSYDELYPLEDLGMIRNKVTEYYDSLIESERSKIREVTTEEKEEEKIQKYNEIKAYILSCAKHMLEAENGYSFENKLKALANYKKELFSIKLYCGEEIRKENGQHKYKIGRYKLYKELNLEALNWNG